jgi:hypothetical protein
MGLEQVAMLGSVTMATASTLDGIGWFAVLIMAAGPAALP